MKKVSLLLAIILVITSVFSHSTDYVQAMQDVLALEAEDGRIYYGKASEENVLLGSEVPQSGTSGVLWWINAETVLETTLTIHYQVEQDATVYVHWGTAGQQVSLPANRTSQQIAVSFAQGTNLIQVLFQSGGAVTIDKVSLGATGVSVVPKTPILTDDGMTLYYACNARIFMGTIVGGANSVCGGECVGGLTYAEGQDIQTSSHVAFTNVNCEKAGKYELVVFCAAEEGSNMEINVNGESYIAKVQSPQGKNVYLSADGTQRSHAIFECDLKAGNNQIMVRGEENIDVQIDTLGVQYLGEVQDLEAEDGRIYYGKVLGKQVVIGQDVPQGETSGILWWGNSQSAQEASLTLHYSANQDAVVYVHWGTGGQYISLPANQTSQKITVTLPAGENLIQVLFQYGGVVTIDKLSLRAPSFQFVTETPVSMEDNSTLYFSRNARIFMGEVDVATNSLSGSCVRGLDYDSGQGIQTSAHVAFQDVYAQEKGIYELIVFCAAEEGSVAEVYIAGKSYIVPVRAAQGVDTYLSDDGSERPHAVLECELQAGNNEVYVRGAYNAQMSFDALKVKLICASQTTIFGDANEDGSRDSRDLVHLKKRLMSEDDAWGLSDLTQLKKMLIKSTVVTNEITAPEGNDYRVETDSIQVEKSKLRDKVLGAWIGHALGMGSGYEYVCVGNTTEPMIAIGDSYWEPNGQIASGTLGANVLRLGPYDPTYQRVSQGSVKSDDDILVDIFNQTILRDYGPNVGYYEITEAWKKAQVGDAAGGEESMRVINTDNYIAPYVGMYAYGNGIYTATEPWIGNETLGLVFPYMPASAEKMADVFTTISGDGYGVYLGRVCALAYSYGLTEDSAPMALEKAFSHMEKSNMIYDAYQYVLQCYRSNPQDWRACVRGLVERSTGQNMMGFNPQIDLYVNAGFIFTGIIFGENDFEKSVKIASLAGYDGDCTAATVGGLLGAVKGYDSIPQKYKAFLGENSVFYNDKTWFSHINNNFPDQQTFGDIVDLTMQNMEAQIVAAGGVVGESVYQIQRQNYTGKVQTIVDNYGFDNGTTSPWQTSGSAQLSVTGTRIHTGPYAGNIYISNTQADAKVFQNLKLVKGDYYQLVMYVSADVGKEFRVYAEDEQNYFYHSYNTPLTSLERFVRVELTFCATSEDMKLGIHIPTQANVANCVTFDDVQLLNVSHKMARSGQLLEAECAQGTPNAHLVESKAASGNAAVALEQNAALRFSVEGEGDAYQSIRVYYKNKASMAVLNVRVDNQKTFRLPLLAQGETSDFSSGNFADFGIFLGEGKHDVVLRLETAGQVEIDKIEVRTGDISS